MKKVLLTIVISFISLINVSAANETITSNNQGCNSSTSSTGGNTSWLQDLYALRIQIFDRSRKINSLDAKLLNDYLYDSEISIDESVADFNGDGVIDIQDVKELQSRINSNKKETN